MATFKYNYVEPQTTITTTDVNDPFVKLKENSDGTTSDIDKDNVRNEGINRNHLTTTAINSDFIVNNTAINSTINSASFAAVKTVTVTGSPVMQIGEVFRCGFGPLIKATTFTSTNNATKVTGIFYFYITVVRNQGAGAVEERITPIMGHGITGSSSGLSVIDNGLSTFWERAPISGLYIARSAAQTITQFKLWARVEENIHSFTLGECSSWSLIARN